LRFSCLSLPRAGIKLGALAHTIIPALGRLRQENLKLDANLGYIARPSIIKPKTKCTKRVRRISHVLAQYW
jgi:hypothetical protein